MKQETMGWQLHQVDYMQIISTSFQTDNHASISPLNFYWCPINTVKAFIFKFFFTIHYKSNKKWPKVNVSKKTGKHFLSKTNTSK